MEHRDPERPDPARPSRQEVRETLIERQIREAMEDGRFDGLPHQGARLPLDDDTAAGEWALAFKMLKDAGVAQPWIEADKEVRRLLADLERLLRRAARSGPAAVPRARAQATRLVHEVNAAIRRLNSEAPTDRQHRRPLELDAVLRRLDAGRDH